MVTAPRSAFSPARADCRILRPMRRVACLFRTSPAVTVAGVPVTVTPASPACAALLCAALLGAATAPATASPRGGTTVVLDGRTVRVAWTDGDTFAVRDDDRAANRGGRQKSTSARLVGVNALESYGPVHRWGDWSARELLDEARTARKLAASRTWTCTSAGRRDRYGRILARCPDLERALVFAGLAHVMAVDDPPDPELVRLQREAQKAGRGIWRGGVPPRIVTSAHAGGEHDRGDGRGGGPGYDRIVDTRDGTSIVREHRNTYRVCEEVCVGDGRDRACMVYVPAERRFNNRPPCLSTRDRAR